MKKLYFLSLLCGLAFASSAQTAALYSTGAAGSYITGSCTSTGTRTDGTIGVSASAFATSRGYAVFDLSTLPAASGITITSCVIGFNDSAYFAIGAPGPWVTYGYAGDLSTVTTPATLYADMVGGTLLSNATYGTATGDFTLPSAAAITNFIHANIGSKVSICFTGGGNAVYLLKGETGNPGITSAPNHAPYLNINYNCTGVSGVTASVSASPVCVGSSVTLSGNGTGTTSYSWSGPGGFTSAAQNPTFTTTAGSAGTYTLTAYNAGGCGTTATTTVSLAASPTASVTASSSPILCTAATLTLTATDAGDTYQWYSSGTAIPGQTNQTYTSTTAGSYSVKVVAPDGCSATSAATVVEVLTPHPPLTPAGSAALCAGGGDLTLSIAPVGLPGVSYQWLVGGTAIAGATNTSYTTGTSGIFTAVIETSGCNDTSQSTTVNIYALPTPTISYDAATGTLSTSSAYGSYQWFLNTVAIPGATNYTLLAPNIGSYRVVVTDVHGCHNFSSPYVLNVLNTSLGLSHPAEVNVNIYPNPASASVHIESSVNVRAVITSIDGKKMLEQQNATDIDINGLSQGLYIVMLYNDAGDRVAIQKLVKE
jgi:hypothetical protein